MHRKHSKLNSNTLFVLKIFKKFSKKNSKEISLQNSKLETLKLFETVKYSTRNDF